MAVSRSSLPLFLHFLAHSRLIPDFSIILSPYSYTSPPIKTSTEYYAVRAVGTFDLTIHHCDLFGANTGLRLAPSSVEDAVWGAKFHMEDSSIRDSISGIAEISQMETESASFHKCTFSGNGLGTKDYGTLPAYGETHDYLSQYSFWGDYIDYGKPVDLPAVFTNCIFTNNKNPHRDCYVSLEEDGEGTFAVYKDCTFEGNSWTEVPSSSAPASAPSPSASSFQDVPGHYWASKEIAWATSLGIMNGVGGGTFSPGENVTCQQAWMVVARIAGNSPANMAAAQEWVTENHISSGKNAAGPLTRQELIKLLFRYARKQHLPDKGPASLKEYPDTPDQQLESEAMSWAVGNGILTGTSDGRLNPGGTITRAQFAVILYRFYQNILS